MTQSPRGCCAGAASAAPAPSTLNVQRVMLPATDSATLCGPGASAISESYVIDVGVTVATAVMSVLSTSSVTSAGFAAPFHSAAMRGCGFCTVEPSGGVSAPNSMTVTCASSMRFFIARRLRGDDDDVPTIAPFGAMALTRTDVPAGIVDGATYSVDDVSAE